MLIWMSGHKKNKDLVEIYQCDKCSSEIKVTRKESDTFALAPCTNCSKKELSITKLQNKIGEWTLQNFGHNSEGAYHPLLGLVEEIGELSHAHLKQQQGIRGNYTEHEKAIKDAIGDIIIYLCDYCYQRGYDLESIIKDTWDSVQKRNWKEKPKDGTNA